MGRARTVGLVAAAALIAHASPALAGNPIITDIYTADPDAFVAGDRFYIDSDQDEAPLGASDFLMRTWHMYSSTDAVNWTHHGGLLSLTDFPWANRNAWAPEMQERDGKFYWYLPMQKAATNSMSIGVAVGDSPLGPFRDALGKPLIDNTTANHSAFDIDPTVFVDDDGQAYIYWGSFSSPRVAKLKENMVELADLPGDGGADGPRVAGRLDRAVKLNGSADHVQLPAGVLNGLTDFTISTWVNPVARPTWSRIFDFGASTTRNMFLTASAGSAPRFAITTSGGGGEQRLNGTAPLALNQWSHVAITLSGTTGRLYVNGELVATNTGMTLNPASLGATTSNYIGRSQYADPYLNATVDDFQIYSRGLDAAEVAVLAGGAAGAGDVAAYRFDEAGGATATDASGSGRDATIVSPDVNVLTPTGLTGYWEAPFMFKRAGTYYMAYARGNPATGGNPATYDYATASNPLGPWTYRGRILDTVTNTTTNHAAIVEFKGQWYVVYHNGALPGGGEFRRSVSVDKLFFNPDGTIQKVVQTLSPEALAPVTTLTDLRFDGAGQHVALPRAHLWNMYDFTVAAWVRLDSARPGQRVFDFGSSPTSHMYLTTQGPTGAPRFAISTSATNELRIDGTAPLPVDRWTHVAVTKSALGAQLYVNGVQAGQHTNLGLYPARLGNAPNNWIGRSQSPDDPYFQGEMDDFRIYQRGLDASEVRSLATVSTGASGEVGGTVPATLSLTVGSAGFGAFQPGVGRTYEASTTANVTSTAGDATLSVSDPGHLTNGTFSLPRPLQVELGRTAWAAPVSNDAVGITFRQEIGAGDALRTGTYSRSLTFTLSTTSP